MRRWLLLTLLCACTQSTNPCPSGSDPLRDEDRCLPPSMFEAGVQESDAGGQQHVPPKHGHDAGHPKPNRPDAGDGDGDMDGGRDTPDTGTPDTGTPDTGTPDSGPAPNPPMCSVDDTQRWSDFHAQNSLVDMLKSCNLCQPNGTNTCETCEQNSCKPADCVRQKLGVEGCAKCVNAEAACAVRWCGSACQNGTSAMCHACVCEAGCTAAFAACDGRSFDVCTNVYGTDASTEDRKYKAPLLYRVKKTTGFVQSFAPQAKAPSAPAFADHWSVGFTNLVSLFIAGDPYLLQHKNGDEPCVARISPVLNNGKLGHPGYVENWSKGWDEMESFETGGQTYLLRYKTGAAGSTDDEPNGRMRIDRITRAADTLALTLTKVYEVAETLPAHLPWSAIETFSAAGSAYVLFYGTDLNGAVKIARVSVTGDQLALVTVSDSTLSLSRDWDVVETVNVGANWYLLIYKSGRLDSNLSLAIGSVQVLPFELNQNKVSLAAPAYQGNWNKGLTQVVGFSTQGHDYLLRHSNQTGYTQVLQVAPSSSWATKLGDDVFPTQDTWSTAPAWDVFDVVRQLPW